MNKIYFNNINQKVLLDDDTKQVLLDDIQIGDIYEGGMIFYKGDGYGFISALDDAPVTKVWGCIGTTIGSTGNTLGDGEANTLDIVGGCADTASAAYYCDNLSLSGYTDWFLPAYDTMNTNMRQELYVKSRGNLTGDGYYWTSTEVSSTQSKPNSFMYGFYNRDKTDSLYVRPIRKYII